MRFNRFDLNLLVVLDALLTELSITKAGEKVFLSQSATSGALSRLREYFNDPILTQVGRKMMLTPLGESLVIPVRESLMQVQSTLESRPNIDISQSERHISIIMSDAPNIIIFSKAVKEASKIAPNITFETVPLPYEPLDELEQGNVDFILLPDKFLAENHPSIELLEENFVVICWDQHNELTDTISREQYKNLGHVMTKFGPRANPGLDAWVTSRSGVERRSEVIVNTFSAVPAFIVGTQRIATVHRRLAKLWASYLPIKILEEPFDIPNFSWCIQWHEIQNTDPVITWFGELMLKAGKELANESE